MRGLKYATNIIFSTSQGQAKVVRYLLEEAGADPDLAMADGKLAVFLGLLGVPALVKRKSRVSARVVMRASQ